MKSYLDLLTKIIEAPDSAWKGNRTGIRAKSISGYMIEHDMNEGFPLLTTKKMGIKTIAAELEFFIKGLTDKKWLQDRKAYIWDEWCNPEKVPYGTDEETKAKMKAERDLGPIYGFQHRHFGAEYINYDTDYTGQGVDQLKNLVDKLHTNPSDRRMIVSAWNPLALSKMALPPCHFCFQVVVTGENFDVLNLNWSQRSCDTPLGIPYNIASYALLLKLLVKEANMKPGRLCGMLGDVHIYENQFETAKLQAQREPYKLPTMEIPNFSNIFDWTYEQVELKDYISHPKLTYPIAV
jgi:thymidylate synthase